MASSAGRPLGVKNKSPAELQSEAKITLLKVKLQEEEAKRKKLAEARRQVPKK